MKYNAIIKFFGSVEKVQEKMGYTRQGIEKWRRNGHIPLPSQKIIEKLSNGKLKPDKEDILELKPLDVIKLFGSIEETSKKLSIRISTIGSWIASGKIPKKHTRIIRKHMK